MSVRIIEGRADGAETDDVAVLYCSTIGVAFGPLFEDHDAAQAFLEWLGRDPRQYTAEGLREIHDTWRQKEQR